MALGTRHQLDEDIDSRHNPAEGFSNNTAASDLENYEKDASEQIKDGLNDSSFFDGDDVDAAEKSLADKENARPQTGFYQPSGGKKKNLSAAALKMLLKKRGGAIGIGAALLSGGGFMAGVFIPTTMPISLHDILIDKNDSLGPSSEIRSNKLVKHMLEPDNSSAACDAKKIRCRMGKPSYKSLNRLSKNGIRAVDDAGNHIDTKQKGYPDKKPAGYYFDNLDDPNKPPKFIRADQLDGFLKGKDNYKYAAKLYGRYGAFKLRTRAWMGKHMKKMFSKIGFKRNGGIAKDDSGDSNGSKGKIAERVAAARKKVLSKMPGKTAMDKISERISKIVSRFVKAGDVATGPSYKVAVGACLTAKLPKMATMAGAAIQLAQLLPIIGDIVLSPGSAAKGAAFGTGFTQEGAEVVGRLLTDRTPRKGDNKLTSALDSKYLLAALGINKGKVDKADFTPGFSGTFLNASGSIAREISGVTEATEKSCDFIMSPAGYYAYVVANQSVNAALAGGTLGMGYFAKLGADWFANEATELIITKTGILEKVVDGIIMPAASWFFQNNNIEGAQGEELGDILGVSATAFFASGNMHGGLSTLTTEQSHAFNNIKRDNEEFHKQMEIASLSPFDTSSRYTFLGSIVNNLGQMMIANGSYNNSASSIMGNILRLPSYALSFGQSTKISAASDSFCSYADTFGYNSTDDGKTPAVNLAGLPCTGLTSTQTNMSTEEAISLLEEAGWLDPSKEDSLSESDDIEELMNKGYITPEQPLAQFIEKCTDSTSGEYILGPAGCTVKDIATDRQFAAISVFLLDYTTIQTINGENDEPEETTGPQTSGDNDIVKAGEMFFDYTYYYGGPAFHSSVDVMKSTIDSIKNGSLAKGTKLTDCSGFVRASIYVATGFDIEAGSTREYGSYVGKTLDEITVNDLKPGDIAWKSGHVEIVAKVEGGQVYTQGARGPNDGGPIGGPSVVGGWTKYYRAKT